MIEIADYRASNWSLRSPRPERHRDAYQKLSNAIRHGSFIPVISFMQIVEWCRHNDRNTAHGIASVLDSATACYEVPPLSISFVLEFAKAISELPGASKLDVPDLLTDANFHPPWFSFLVETCPSYRDDWRRTGLIGMPKHRNTMVDRIKWQFINTASGNLNQSNDEWFLQAFAKSKDATSLEQKSPTKATLA